MSLSERRHHEERTKNNVKKYYNGWAGETDRNIGKVAHTKCLCSKICCRSTIKNGCGFRHSDKRRMLDDCA